LPKIVTVLQADGGRCVGVRPYSLTIFLKGNTLWPQSGYGGFGPIMALSRSRPVACQTGALEQPKDDRTLWKSDSVRDVGSKRL